MAAQKPITVNICFLHNVRQVPSVCFWAFAPKGSTTISFPHKLVLPTSFFTQASKFSCFLLPPSYISMSIAMPQGAPVQPQGKLRDDSSHSCTSPSTRYTVAVSGGVVCGRLLDWLSDLEKKFLRSRWQLLPPSMAFKVPMMFGSRESGALPQAKGSLYLSGCGEGSPSVSLKVLEPTSIRQHALQSGLVLLG